MEESEGGTGVAAEHPRCVVHVDVDCFYAQVEELKHPEMRGAPLGVRQKNLVVTANYEARRRGVGKCVPVEEALRLCPDLQLVRGEDLQDYRAMSDKIFLLLQTFQCPVEKLGMDENFVDVTSVVAERTNGTENGTSVPSGHIFGAPNNECLCGCHSRLNIASHVASEVRQKLYSELGITCSAGIAHNKLLAKLVGSINKPNDQTLIYPESAESFVVSLTSLRSIPSIGAKTAETLSALGLSTVVDLQMAPIEDLKKNFSADMAVRLKNLSYGIDNTAVKQSGKPASIGLEDSFKTVSVQSEVEEKFTTLLSRLVALVREDGRIPVSLRVTLRKKDSRRLSSHRESRQCQISPSIFTVTDGTVMLTESGQEKLMTIIMRLFNKLIDLSKPFHLTLVGLAFTKFRERMTGRSSIVNYLMNDISVQSVMSLQNDCDTSVTSMDYSAASPSGSTTTDFSEGEVEPSPKKAKRVNWIAKRRCLSKEDIASPSKLNVGELRLNSKELEKVSELRLNSRDSLTPADSPTNEMAADASNSSREDDRGFDCPRYVDKEVFNSLPDDMQQELKVMWKNAPGTSNQKTVNKSKSNTILRYFIPNK